MVVHAGNQKPISCIPELNLYAQASLTCNNQLLFNNKKTVTQSIEPGADSKEPYTAIKELHTNIRGNTGLHQRNKHSQSWKSHLSIVEILSYNEEPLTNTEETAGYSKESLTNSRGNHILHCRNIHMQSWKSCLTVKNFALTVKKQPTASVNSTPQSENYNTLFFKPSTTK